MTPRTINHGAGCPLGAASIAPRPNTTTIKCIRTILTKEPTVSRGPLVRQHCGIRVLNNINNMNKLVNRYIYSYIIIGFCHHVQMNAAEHDAQAESLVEIGARRFVQVGAITCAPVRAPRGRSAPCSDSTSDQFITTSTDAVSSFKPSNGVAAAHEEPI